MAMHYHTDGTIKLVNKHVKSTTEVYHPFSTQTHIQIGLEWDELSDNLFALIVTCQRHRRISLLLLYEVIKNLGPKKQAPINRATVALEQDK